MIVSGYGRSMPSTRYVLATFALLILPGIASAQRGTDIDVGTVSTFLDGPSSFFGTLVVGALILALVPEFVDRIVDRIHDETGMCFGWGVLVLLVFLGAVLLLIVTIVGILVVIPLAIGFGILGAAGNALGYLALFAPHIESRWAALVVGAAISGIAAMIPIVGGLLGFVVSSLGTGAIVREWQSNR
jgi:MFS family permease